VKGKTTKGGMRKKVHLIVGGPREGRTVRSLLASGENQNQKGRRKKREKKDAL